MRRTSLTLTLLFCACSSSPITPAGDLAGESSDMAMAPAGSLTITTASGAVTGKSEGTTRAFLGIPYAAPPVGPLRWKPPQPVAAWTKPLDVNTVGAICPQIPFLTTDYDPTSNEDCLTLNVWTPLSTASARPVMVFLHGGSFTSGSGGIPLYDGQLLSQEGNLVVVTINYRLGALGFLAHSALTSEDPAYKSSGNYGLEDQRAALKWVNANIAGFGGDPTNITLFGESAGASSVFTHLASTESKGLFQRAIAESGYNDMNPTQMAAETQGAMVATAVGCTDAPTVLTCLRGKTAQEIVLALPEGGVGTAGASWGPVIDNLNLTANPLSLLHDGTFQHMPLVLGSNGNEGTLFLAQATITTDADYKAFLTNLLGAEATTFIVAQYPSASFPTPKAAAAAVIGDAVFVCPIRRVARDSVAVTDPTFLYRFAHAINFPLIPDLGSFHSSELPFVFGNPYGTFAISGAEIGLSDSMMGYWTRFATTGDPNGMGAVTWPAYAAASDENLTLDLTITSGANLNKSNCDFWDQFAAF